MTEKEQKKQAKALKKVAKALGKAGLGGLPAALVPVATAGVAVAGVCVPGGTPVQIFAGDRAFAAVETDLTCEQFAAAGAFAWHLTALAAMRA